MILGLVAAIGVLAFLFLYFAFNLDQEHFLLKFMLIFFFAFTIILLPNAVINNSCVIDVQNTTVSGSTTVYNYESYCDNTTTQTENTFLKIPLWFFRILVTYFSIYIAHHWFKRSEKFQRWFDRLKR